MAGAGAQQRWDGRPDACPRAPWGARAGDTVPCHLHVTASVLGFCRPRGKRAAIRHRAEGRTGSTERERARDSPGMAGFKATERGVRTDFRCRRAGLGKRFGLRYAGAAARQTTDLRIRSARCGVPGGCADSSTPCGPRVLTLLRAAAPPALKGCPSAASLSPPVTCTSTAAHPCGGVPDDAAVAARGRSPGPQ